MENDFHKKNNNNSRQCLKNTYLQHFLFVNYKKKNEKKRGKTKTTAFVTLNYQIKNNEKLVASVLHRSQSHIQYNAHPSGFNLKERAFRL